MMRYEGRYGLSSNFDSIYCYALGYAAGALLQSGKTGLISSGGNLAAPVGEWTVGGTALTSLMDVGRRHAMKLSLSLEKLTNEKLLKVHGVKAIKKIAEYVAQLRRVGKGHVC